MAITTLLFDFDDTLVPDKDSLAAALHDACGGIIDFPADDAPKALEVMLECARKYWRMYPCHAHCDAMGISSWEALAGTFSGEDDLSALLCDILPQYRQSTWRDFLMRFEVHGENHDVMANAFVAARKRRRQPYGDVCGVLERLRKKYRIAILTNGHVGWQYMKICDSGLEGNVDRIIASGQFGEGKPSPKVFRGALDQLGIQASEAVMIGDSLRKDIAGAQAVDIKGVWVNRQGVANSTEWTPNCEVTSLLDIERAVLSFSLNHCQA